MAPRPAGSSCGLASAFLLRAKTCLDPPFCFTYQVSPRIRTPLKDNPHQGQSVVDPTPGHLTSRVALETAQAAWFHEPLAPERHTACRGTKGHSGSRQV